MKFTVYTKQYNKSLNLNFLSIVINFDNSINVINIAKMVLQLHSLALILS